VFVQEFLHTAQEGIDQNNLFPAFHTIKRLSGMGVPSELALFKKADGSVCSSSEEILQRYPEHFESDLNFLPTTIYPELITVVSQAYLQM